MLRPPAPAALWLVRHAQSQGNVAREQAETARSEVIELGCRDADVALSDLGEKQARAFGRWVCEQPPERRPAAVVSSPYVRTRRTAEIILEEAGGALGRVDVDIDERLRDRELGVLDTLTTAGVLARHPQEAERRKLLDKFYHRPPGGESW